VNCLTFQQSAVRPEFARNFKHKLDSTDLDTSEISPSTHGYRVVTSCEIFTVSVNLQVTWLNCQQALLCGPSSYLFCEEWASILLSVINFPSDFFVSPVVFPKCQRSLIVKPLPMKRNLETVGHKFYRHMFILAFCLNLFNVCQSSVPETCRLRQAVQVLLVSVQI
jgi:hypothetical protein